MSTKSIKPTRDEARMAAKMQLALLKNLIKQYPKVSITVLILAVYDVISICKGVILLIHLIASLF